MRFTVKKKRKTSINLSDEPDLEKILKILSKLKSVSKPMNFGRVYEVSAD